LCVKALLRPLNPGLSGNDDDEPDVNDDDDDDYPPLVIVDESDDEIDETDRDVDGAGLSENDDPDDEIDELEELDEQGPCTIIHKQPLLETLFPRSVFFLLSLAIIHSTTKALPIWRSRCIKAGPKANLIPRDVVTRWNSTYDMLRSRMLHPFCQ
ncbi:hypothetical protein BDR03DRAFT_1007830, partial [Suillus americanus]